MNRICICSLLFWGTVVMTSCQSMQRSENLDGSRARKPENTPNSISQRGPGGELVASIDGYNSKSGAFVRHGPFRQFYKSGAVAVSGTFTTGKPTGDWYSYFASGKPCSHVTWGIPNSKWDIQITPFQQIEPSKEAPPSLFLSGTRISHSDRGELLFDMYVFGLTTRYVSFFPEGGRRSLQSDDVYMEWDSGGSLLHERHFRNGKVHGTCRSWHRNGRLGEMTDFQNDEKFGSSIKWDESGRIVNMAEYRSDIPVGTHLTVDYNNGFTIMSVFNQSGAEIQRIEIVDGRVTRYSK